MPRALVLAALLCAGATTWAAAQQQPSLADVARRVEAERAERKSKPARTYTNSDLAQLPTLPPPPSTAAGESVGVKTDNEASRHESATRSDNPGNQAAAAAPAQTEDAWRKRAAKIRDLVDHSQVRLAKLLSRPRNPNATLQQRDEKEIAGIRGDLTQYRLQWATLEQEARAAKISMTWIEPAPQFPQQQ